MQINEEHLNTLASDYGADFVVEILGVFEDTAPSVLDEMLAAFESKDLKVLEMKAHKLNGMCLSMAFNKVSEVFAKIEKESHTASEDVIQLDLKLAQEYITAIMAEIKTYISQLEL